MTIRVLIVDDEESICVTLAEFVKDDQYEVHTAADAEEALRLIEDQPFDVVVTDIVLPRMNGVALLGEIRKRWPDTQVVMLTGDPTVETAAKAVRAGAFDYLTKPVTKNAINRVVANAAQVKQLTDEKRRLEEENEKYQEGLEQLVQERTEGLREKEEFNRRIIESSEDCIKILDLKGNLLYMSSGGQALLEIDDIEPYLGKSWIDFWQDANNVSARQAVGKAAHGKAASFQGYSPTAKGTPKWWHVIVSPIMGPDGKVEQLLATSRDITKHRQAQDKLQESEARYRGIVQYQTECIIDRWLPDGTLAFVNGAYCQFYGKSRDELIGRNWIESVAREDLNQARAYVERFKDTVTQEEPVQTSELREVAADGQVRWMQWTDQAIFNKHGNLVEFQSVGRDMTEHKRAQEEREHLLRQQIAMNELSLALGNYVSLQEIYDTLYRYVAELIETDALYISSYNKNEQLIKAEYVRDEYGHIVDPATLPPLKLEGPGHGTQSQAIRSGKPVYIPDILEAMEKIKESYDIASNGTVTRDTVTYSEQEDVLRSELLAPILFKGEVIGVIAVESLRVDAYAQTDLDLLSGLANVAAVAIENAHLQEGLKKTLEDTIRAVGLTTEMRDPYTARHQERVTELACAIARKMRIPEQQIKGIHSAGLLHDIGKIAVPAEILTKPGKLNDLEFSLIRRHPQVAYDILKGIEFPWPIADIVLQHHERMNGSGYPNGLKGDEILLEARILAVADVVEAISSHRPYRAALGLDAALDEIKQGRGTLYDPDVVDTCLGVFEEGFSLD